MQALGPEAGQAFLDIGSGTGYLTMVAANLVGHTGKAVGLEVTLWHNNPISLTATLHFVMALTLLPATKQLSEVREVAVCCMVCQVPA